MKSLINDRIQGSVKASIQGALRDNPIVLLLSVIVILVLSFDATTRLSSQSDKEQSFHKLVAPGDPSVLSLTGEQQKQLIASLAPFIEKLKGEAAEGAGKDSEEVKLPTLSLEEQAQQEGELARLFAGDFSYELVAVFHQEKTFAVFLKTDTNTAKSELISLPLLGSIEKYTLTRVETSHVEFQNEDRKILIRLFQLS